jgi:hypothetical protein
MSIQNHICSSYTSCELAAHHDDRGIDWGRRELYFSSLECMDVLGKHVEVVAHAVGGVCYSNGVPLGDMEERVASPKVFA